MFLGTAEPDGSGFHLFIKDSVSLSREEVEKEEDEEVLTVERTEEVGENAVED